MVILEVSKATKDGFSGHSTETTKTTSPRRTQKRIRSQGSRRRWRTADTMNSRENLDNSLELLHPFSLIHPSSKMRHFPLLDLPLVSKEHVLAMMDPYEWINFSLASRKAYSAVKTFLKNKSFLTVIISTEAEPYIVITGKHESWNFEWTQTLSMVGYKTNRTGDRKVNTLYKYSENPIESLKLDFGYMREIIAIELVYVTFDMKSFPNQNKSITNWLRFHPTCRIEITSSNEQCDDDLKYAMENLVVTDSMWLRCVDFSQDFQMELPRTPRIRIDKSSFISFEQLLKLENQSISLFRPRLSAEDINGFVRNWMSCRTHLHLKTFDIDLSNFESMNIIMDVPHEETNDSHIANSFDESFQCRCGVREGFDIKRSDGKLARVAVGQLNGGFRFYMITY
uniref:F-box domain-containing protein n=1 Tax=Caenorhabditis tropicalis TaxID=1561998 RepID=A0A1I7T7W1_9PELO